MARRKKSLGEIAFQTVMFLGILLFVSSRNPSMWAALRPFIAVVVICSAAVALLVLLKRLAPKIKGKVGERIVSTRLRDGLSAETYTVLDNVYLPVGEEGTTQIDHIVVSPFGVFVVETKNYSGWIFASSDSPVWTQTIYHKKNTFQNPIRQNYRHLCAISENLGIPMDYLHGVVAFTGDCTFKTEMPEGVVYSRDAAALIQSYDKVRLKDVEVKDIVSALREWNSSVTTEQRNSHVEKLRASHASVHTPVARKSAPSSGFLTCPKCGAPLVKRNRHSDCAPFYSCSRYPHCHYTRRIDI